MNRNDALAAFIAAHGTNAPGIFLTMSDSVLDNGATVTDPTFNTLYAMVNTDSDIDEMIEDIDAALGNDDDDDTDALDNVSDDVDDILGDIDDDEISRACDTIIRVAADLTLGDVTLIMGAAGIADPTFSGSGAMIRDAIRDNTDFSV